MSVGDTHASGDEPVGEFLVRALAAACKRDPAALGPDTPLLALELDSLSLVAVLSQVEAVYGIALTDTENTAMLTANTVRELVALVARARHSRPDQPHGFASAPGPE